MSASYTPLQGDPPPYTDIERGDSQAEPTNTGNDNECLKPGELARVVHRDNSDEIVKVVPMRAGWDSSSTIEVKRSALPELRSPRTIIGWILISYFLACSNYRFLSSEWATALMLFVVFFPPGHDLYFGVSRCNFGEFTCPVPLVFDPYSLLRYTSTYRNCGMLS